MRARKRSGSGIFETLGVTTSRSGRMAGVNWE